MNEPSTAREALIIEAIGQVAALLDRVDRTASALDSASDAATRSCAELAAQVAAMEARVAQLVQHAQVQAVRHIARHTHEMARSQGEAQAQAMADAARLAFRTEMASAFHRLTQALDLCRQRVTPLSANWWSHLLTAVSASAATWMLAALVLAR